jgi:hypothetical protein
MATIESKSFMKYFFFIFVFIVSFSLINLRRIETFGLVLFFVVNILFFLSVGKDLFDGSISSEGKDTEWSFKYGIVIVSMVFSFVASIMMILTLVTLQGKFADVQSDIKWSPSDRKDLDTAEIIFITVTTLIGTTLLYVYNTPEDVRKATYHMFDLALNGSASNWLRVLFPIVILGLGSALYGRLQMQPLEVNKTPKQIICAPLNDPSIQQFKDSFIKTFWFLFAFIIIVLGRPFVEANFNVSGLSPSSPFGFPPGDRSLIFGQNPSFSILSILTLGISNLLGANKSMRKKLDEEPASLKSSWDVFAIKSSLFAFLAGFIVLCVMSTKNAIANKVLIGTIIVLVIALCVFMFLPNSMNPLAAKDGGGKLVAIALRSILLMPVLRWDVLYLSAKYAFGIVALVYAGFSIRDFKDIPDDSACFYKDAHIRQLYIAFITFLITFYALNTLTANIFTSIVTNIMRFLVPPALLGMSSYLIFTTNEFMKMAPNLVIQ